MRNVIAGCLAVCGAALFAAEALAQAPAPAAVPDQMPFDVPYGTSITADRGAEIVKAVVAEATKGGRNWKLAITIVDISGDLVYFYKMDGTQVASVAISQGKARTAARFRRPSGLFFNVMQKPEGAFVGTLDPTLVASPGGFPLVEGGKLIGAVGCSGATGDQDGVACKAGADTVK
jgi:glc operon protein GlcG